MKKKLPTILLLLIFFVGLSVVLYPSISNYINERVSSRAIADYVERAADFTPEEYEMLREEADSFNEQVRNAFYPLKNYAQLSGYEEALNPFGDGMMGYITIPKIDVELPIYHGTADETIKSAVGHLEGTTLPVGGTTTHCVLTGHRGLPRAKLFTDLDRLEVGDTFTLFVLDQQLTYMIDQILIVEPTNVSELRLVEGEDYCTLLTCTPYGVNTHRMLVRGRRIEGVGSAVYVPADAHLLNSIILVPLIAAPMILLLFIFILVRYRKKC